MPHLQTMIVTGGEWWRMLSEEENNTVPKSVKQFFLINGI